MTFASALCAGAIVNSKEKRLAIHGKGYKDSLKFRKMKRKKNTKKATTFAHLGIIAILFVLKLFYIVSNE